MKMHPLLRAIRRTTELREKQYRAYTKAKTRYAIFLYDPLNMYRRESAVTRKLYKLHSAAEAEAQKMGPQFVARTVTLTDEEAGVTRP